MSQTRKQWVYVIERMREIRSYETTITLCGWPVYALYVNEVIVELVPATRISKGEYKSYFHDDFKSLSHALSSVKINTTLDRIERVYNKI